MSNYERLVVKDGDKWDAAKVDQLQDNVEILKDNIESNVMSSYQIDKETNCLYHMVGEEQEWVNPPMKNKVEYRTIKRFFGNPVYTKAINVGTVEAKNDKSFTIENIDQIVTMAGYACKENAVYPIPGFGSKEGTPLFNIRKSGTITFMVYNYNDNAFDVYVYIEYTKK